VRELRVVDRSSGDLEVNWSIGYGCCRSRDLVRTYVSDLSACLRGSPLRLVLWVDRHYRGEGSPLVEIRMADVDSDESWRVVQRGDDDCLHLVCTTYVRQISSVVSFVSSFSVR
jgi:hypothetical protein